MTDVEVAVCFADLRGFTKYVDAMQAKWQDRKVQDFLGSYFQVYPKAVLERVYALEAEVGKDILARDEAVRRIIVPSMFKNLGDGMMLVWELEGPKVVQDAVTANILQMVAAIQRFFTHLISQEATGPTKQTSAVSKLRLGFGLARGHAWRLAFGPQRSADYAGSIVNLAARLQDLARPEGIVAQVGFCDPVLSKAAGTGGRKAWLKGLEKPVEVWASPTVKLKRHKRTS